MAQFVIAPLDIIVEDERPLTWARRAFVGAELVIGVTDLSGEEVRALSRVLEPLWPALRFMVPDTNADSPQEALRAHSEALAFLGGHCAPLVAVWPSGDALSALRAAGIKSATPEEARRGACGGLRVV